MATIVGSNGGTVIAGTEASDVIYGYYFERRTDDPLT